MAKHCSEHFGNINLFNFHKTLRNKYYYHNYMGRETKAQKSQIAKGHRVSN